MRREKRAGKGGFRARGGDLVEFWMRRRRASEGISSGGSAKQQYHADYRPP